MVLFLFYILLLGCSSSNQEDCKAVNIPVFPDPYAASYGTDYNAVIFTIDTTWFNDTLFYESGRLIERRGYDLEKYKYDSNGYVLRDYYGNSGVLTAYRYNFQDDSVIVDCASLDIAYDSLNLNFESSDEVISLYEGCKIYYIESNIFVLKI